MPKDKIQKQKKRDTKETTKPIKKKSIFGKKYCHRCKRGGHTSSKCTFGTTSKGFLIKSDAKKRKPAGDRKLRETSEIPASIFENAESFYTFTEESIEVMPLITSGIYEIGLSAKRKQFSDLTVVYVGMSGDIRERLKDHIIGDRVVDGKRRTSNIVKMTSDCRNKGYNLYFRYKCHRNEKEAKEAESGLLEAYDYAWNLEENGKSTRFIF